MNRRSKAIAAAAGLAVLSVILYWWTRPNLADQARTVAHAILTNDPETVYDYTLEFQREQIGMTRDQFVRYWQTLIAPTYARYKPRGPIESIVAMGDVQGLAWAPSYNDRGQRWDFDVGVWDTSRGGRRELLVDLIHVWTLRHLIEQGRDPTDSVARVEAILAGLREDRTTLESLGITRIPGHMPNERPVTLDEWERRLVRLLEELKRNQPKADP